MSTSSSPPEPKSSVRELIASAGEEMHIAYPSLADAKKYREAVAILEGDSGGQIYVVARADLIRCEESVLEQLLFDLDAIEWSAPEDCAIHYEAAKPGEVIPGGMGGAIATESVWVHPRLAALESAIRAVLEGAQSGVAQ
jgi:hypothetical protein